MPPRHGKTVTVARMFPFHYLTMFPQREVVYVAHSAEFAAEQGELLRAMILEHGPKFGITVSGSSSAKDDFDIADLDGRPTGGSYRCFGVNTGIHGRGAHLLLLDDLFKNVEDATSAVKRDTIWRTYTSSLHTRLVPEGAVVSIGTPLHADDWFGRAQQVEEDGGESWDWVRLPALAEEDDPLGREEGDALWPEAGWTVEVLEKKRDNLIAAGEFRDWQSQYALQPISGDGVSEWPDTYFEDVFKPWSFTDAPWTSVLSVDTSKGAKAQKKGDWQAFTLCEPDSKGHIRVRSELCRLDVKGLRKKAIELVKDRWHPQAVVVETNGAGYALLEDLWDAGISALGRYHASHENKIVRITQRLGRALEAGILHFDSTPSNKLLVSQGRLFPHAKYDDGIDSLEMGLEFISQLKLQKAQRKVHYQSRIAA